MTAKKLCRRLLVPALLMISSGAWAQTSADTYSLDTPVETIAAHPAAAAVLNRDIPGLLSNENYGSFKVLNLKQLRALSGGRMTRQMLARTETDLKAIQPARKAAGAVNIKLSAAR